jgi:hypothetical protein
LGERRGARGWGEEGAAARGRSWGRRGRSLRVLEGGGLIYARGNMGCGGLLGRFWLLGRIWAGSAGSKNPALGKELICAESKALSRGNFIQN